MTRAYDIALDAVSQMPAIDNYFRSAAEYEQSLIDRAKDNPFFRLNQIVAAYTTPCQGILIAYGRIIRMEWNDKWQAWAYDILTLSGPTIWSPSYCLREVGPEEARLLFVQIDGGKENMQPARAP